MARSFFCLLSNSASRYCFCRVIRRTWAWSNDCGNSWKSSRWIIVSM